MTDLDEPLFSNLLTTMADIFLALVAVVVLVLLTLVPAISTPGALTASERADLDNATVLIDGRQAFLVSADAEGLSFGAPGERIAVDEILDDAALGEALLGASGSGRDILLVVTPDGQEAAFLFESLAGTLEIGGFHRLRLDGRCLHLADPGQGPCTVGPP